MSHTPYPVKYAINFIQSFLLKDPAKIAFIFHIARTKKYMKNEEQTVKREMRN